jgi:hypothetical protein
MDLKSLKISNLACGDPTVWPPCSSDRVPVSHRKQPFVPMPRQKSSGLANPDRMTFGVP